MLRLEKPKDNFTIVCNELLRDKRLSLRAKGLYALMFSKPHDWVFYEGALVEGSTVVNSSQGGGSKDTWIVDVDGRVG